MMMLERLSRGHVRREVELRRPRPVPAVCPIQRIAHVGLGARMQASVDGVAEPLRFCEQVREFSGDQLQLDLVHGLAIVTGDHRAVVQ